MVQRKHSSVLFLCTGNYYRSRFAEILFNSVAGKMGLPWRASSRGLALERGVNNVGPMAASAITALEALGVRATEAVVRLPAQVTTEDLEQANRIIALKHAEHLPLLQERFPAWVGKVEFWHVDDAPEAMALIEQEVMVLVARILGGGERHDSLPTLANLPPTRNRPRSRNGEGRQGNGGPARQGRHDCIRRTARRDWPSSTRRHAQATMRYWRDSQGWADRNSGRSARAHRRRVGEAWLQGKAGRRLT